MLAASIDFKPVLVKDKTGGIVLIRPYNHSVDRNKLVDMYVTFTPENRCLGLPPTTRRAIEIWVDYLAANGFAIVAECDGKIVGHLAVLPTEDGRKVDLTVFVHQDYQNRGIGQHMLRLIIDYCSKRGYESIMLVTCRMNNRAIHVYKKMGFEVVDQSYECEMHLRLR
jgi:GNAT superfamily N-acetyltransferase